MSNKGEECLFFSESCQPFEVEDMIEKETYMRKFVALLLIVLLSAVFSYCVIGEEEFDYQF